METKFLKVNLKGICNIWFVAKIQQPDAAGLTTTTYDQISLYSMIQIPHFHICENKEKNGQNGFIRSFFLSAIDPNVMIYMSLQY